MTLSNKENKKRKIAYVSGTRADFGLMTSVLRAISQSEKLDLLLYVTGMHLMPEFGKTIEEVKLEFKNIHTINAFFKGDDRLGMADFTGDFLKKFIKVLKEDKPDFVLTLGDRPEMLCVAVACLYLGIPSGQIAGGEKTSTVDEFARHAITKLSHIHFPSTKESARRIEKMGEEKWRIHVIGAPALDVILNEQLPGRKELFRELGIEPDKKIILLNQHPVSEEWQKAGEQIRETLEAVKIFNLPVVVTYPHADAGGRKIIKEIEKERNNPLFHIFPSLEYKKFLALEREAAVWVGNSSAGMVESSSFKTPVINVGTRQLGRQRGENVIDVGYDRNEIRKAIEKSLNDKRYLAELEKIKNPWGDGKTGPRVSKILEELEITPKLLTKQITY